MFIMLLPGTLWCMGSAEIQPTETPGTETKQATATPSPNATKPADYWALFSWQSCLEKLDLDVDIAFYGDSIIRGGDWQDWFPTFSICNLGYSGDTIKGLIDRTGMVKAVNPEKVFILIDVNNTTSPIYADIMRNGYIDLIQKLRQDDPDIKIYAISILPTREPNKRDNDGIRSANEEISKLSLSYDFQYIDLHDLFSDENGEMKQEYTIDGIHLNGDGYKLFVQEIAAYVYE